MSKVLPDKMAKELTILIFLYTYIILFFKGILPRGEGGLKDVKELYAKTNVSKLIS